MIKQSAATPETFSERWELLRPYVGFSLLVLILVGGGVWAFSEFRHEQKAVEIVKSEETQLPEATSAGGQSSPVSKITVDVAGAVVSPGVYELLEDARVTDALDRAGGISDEADQEWLAKNLNLAAKLSDGDKIYIPTTKELPDKASTPVPAPTPQPSAGLVSGAETSDCSRVNINTASAATLDECLSGIGPTYAQRIVEYRQSHGGFKSIGELQNVRGIGPKTFERIKDQITVD